MAVPGSGGELQSPRFVCDACGALFHHVPEACLVCAGKVRPRSRVIPVSDPRLDVRRRRILYAFVSGWILLLASFVAYTALDDPTKGHAGRAVYPDELSLQNFRRGGPGDPLNAARIFRLTRSDRIEKVGGPVLPADGAAVPNDVWIRVTSGPHAGRTGVIVW